MEEESGRRRSVDAAKTLRRSFFPPNLFSLSLSLNVLSPSSLFLSFSQALPSEIEIKPSLKGSTFVHVFQILK